MAHPEHELQVMVTKFVRNCVPMPHFFCGIDRSQRHGEFEHVRQKARGLISGTPDTLLIVPGLPAIAIELKAPGNKPTEAQLRVRDAIQAAGGIWGWCDTVFGYAAILLNAGVPMIGRWDIAAAGHDATLVGAAIRREEAKTGVVSKKRAYRRPEVKPTTTQLRAVARIRAAGIRI
jgi:hypothetical protein